MLYTLYSALHVMADFIAGSMINSVYILYVRLVVKRI